MHTSPQLAILGAFLWISDAAWWLGVLLMVTLRRVALTGKNWIVLATVGVILVCPVVPYGVWQGLTAGVLALSPASNDILVQLAAEGDMLGAKTLLDKGIDANAFDSTGCCPLVAAVTGDQHEMAALLLRRGAKPNVVACGGDTALHRAAQRGDEATVRLLLANGANPSLKNRNGFTASELAWAANHKVVAALVDNPLPK